MRQDNHHLVLRLQRARFYFVTTIYAENYCAFKIMIKNTTNNPTALSFVMSIWTELQCFGELVTVKSSVQHEHYHQQGKLEKWRRYNTIVTSTQNKAETAK